MGTAPSQSNNLASDIQVSEANAKYMNSFPGLAMSTLKGLWSATGIPQQFEQGVQQSQQTQQPGQNKFESGLNQASGVATALTAPFAPVARAVGAGINAIAKPISNIPAVQKFSNTPAGIKTARVAGDVANAANIAGTALGAYEAFTPKVKGGFLDSTITPGDKVQGKSYPPGTVRPSDVVPPDEPPPPGSSTTVKTTTAKPPARTTLPAEGTTKEPVSSPANLKPVETSDEKTTPTLSKKIAANAIAEHLRTTLGALPELGSTDWETQGDRAAEIDAMHPDVIDRIAEGKEAPPEGLLAMAALKASEDRATMTGNIDLIDRLVDSPLAGAAKRMGQEIGYLSQRDDLSPVDTIREIREARSARSTPTRVRATVTEARNAARSVPITKDAWSKFIDDISCNS